MVVNSVPYYEQLASFDDYATALVVDPILGFTTHKMSSQWKSLRSKKSTIEPIISEYRLTQDAEFTFERLMECHPHWYKYFTSLKTPRQFKTFKEHVIRYIHIQHPLSGFMISICHRFSTDDRKECKVRVTKKWCAGEFIPKLCGVIAEMSPEEEAHFVTPGVNDFSVMFSTRKNISQLWLGPAAYINHDCKPNCKFVFVSRDVACVQVIRDMDVGDEVMVYYGDFFFGENNEHCGCKTCQRSSRGLFSTGKPTEIGVQIKGEDRSYSLRATNQRSNPQTKRCPHLSLFLADEEEGSIYNLIPRPIVKSDSVVVFSKPLKVSSSQESRSRECRALTQSSSSSQERRTPKVSKEVSKVSKCRELRPGSRVTPRKKTHSSTSSASSNFRSSKRSPGSLDKLARSVTSKTTSTPRKRALTRSSCVLQLVDRRKSAKLVNPEIRAISIRSNQNAARATRTNQNAARTTRTNQNPARVTRSNQNAARTTRSNQNPACSTKYDNTTVRQSRDPTQNTPTKVLRSSGSVERISVKSSPASISSDSDNMLSRVYVPKSDRVLRKR